jgi:hypothetical protein
VKREELEHVLRAASGVVEQRDFLVVGSAAIPGRCPDAAFTTNLIRPRLRSCAPNRPRSAAGELTEGPADRRLEGVPLNYVDQSRDELQADKSVFNEISGGDGAICVRGGA